MNAARRILAVLALAGCASTLTACETSPEQTIVFIGDSITVSAAGRLVQVAQIREHGYVVAFEAIGATGIGDCAWYWCPRLPPVFERARPDVVVIGLGTNDLLRSLPTLDTPGPDVERILATIPAGVPVVWILPGQPAGARADRTPDALYEYLAGLDARPEVTTLDPFATMGPGMFQGDGIHLTEQGIERYSDLVIAAVDALTA